MATNIKVRAEVRATAQEHANTAGKSVEVYSHDGITLHVVSPER